MVKVQKKLQNYLILNKFLCSLFSLKHIKDFQDILKLVQEGISPNKKFYFTEVLQTLRIPEDLHQKLNIYDENIQNYLIVINSKRIPPIQLKYFQYIAIIFTEIYLDNVFNNFDSFFSEFSNYVFECNQKEKKTGIYTYPYPDKQNMRKLAYWAATGSGKTIITHINILQIQKYLKQDFDNYLLITPNESLSTQHIKELNLSSIKNKKFNSKINLEKWLKVNPIKVVEITKIRKDVSSQDGKTIPVEAFGNCNILFVDEGHKGHSTEAKVWVNIRKELVGKKGFTFEYSATFGEITDKDDTFNDYACSIIFDYRYKFFYDDGFGKDYNILNLKNEKDYGDEYFSFSILSFYEQILYYQHNPEKIKYFNFEKPLMIFVGTYVSGKKNNSDVFFIVKFLARFVNETKYFSKIIEKILTDQSSLIDLNNQPISQFKHEYLKKYVQENNWKYEDLYTHLLQTLFYCSNPCKVQFIELSNAEGEIGLKFGSIFFGLINIGNPASFLKLIKDNRDNLFIIGAKSNFEQSLFNQIEGKNSTINFLIGSKKFIEGWNSYRVSSMGLLNIGKSEGTQIIQLFGRGVRLKGFKNLLKRSYALEVENVIPEGIEIPNFLTILETLNIFGLNADYMTIFRESLKENGVEEYEKFILKIRPNFPETSLYIPRETKKFSSFISEIQILGIGQRIPKVILNLSSKVERIESKSDISLKAENSLGEKTIQKELIDLVDFDRVFFELLKYKETKMYTNFYFEKEDLIKKINSYKGYAFYCDEDLLKLHPSDEIIKIQRIEDYLIQLLKNILDKTYKFEKFRWQQDNLNYETISSSEENLIPREYVFIVNANTQDLIGNIKDFVNQLDTFIREKSELSDTVYKQNTDLQYKGNKILDFFALYIHLFQPLIYKNKRSDSHDLQFIKIKPMDLVESERDFIKLIEQYINQDSKLKYDEIYLLRNPSRKGIGFFETKNFYPDFILWIIKDKRQIINFIDPKGLVFVDKNDEKLTLYKEIKTIEKELNTKTQLNIQLNSFILSKTNFLDLRWNIPKVDLINQNILFLEDKLECISQLFKI